MRLLVLFMLFVSFKSFSRGGDIIGNGGGIAESNFVHAYARIYKLIDNCLSSNYCTRNEKDFYDLLNIREASANNIRNIDRLIFSSPDKMPEIFYTHDADVVRLAVTGLKATDPIYVNLDLLYTKKNGKEFPALSYGEIVAILIHEMGHNVGIKDHTHLDFLGSLVRDFMEQRFFSEQYHVGNNTNSTVFDINLMNFSDEMKISEFWINWKSHSFNITDKVYMGSHCSSGDKPFSIKYTNYHREKPIVTGHLKTQAINIWAQLICVDGAVKRVEIIDTYIYLNVDLKTGKSSIQLKLKDL